MSASVGLRCKALEETAAFVPDQIEARWYAAYTNANHEKSIARQISQRSVEHFLPLYNSVRRWKDRRVNLQCPLFPGYVFVRLQLCDRLRVLQVPGVVRLVGCSGVPTALPEAEIDSLRLALLEGVRPEPHRYLTAGRRVRITAGPLAGHEGILKKWKGDLRVVLSIDAIQRSIAVEVDGESVVPIQHNHKIYQL